MDFKRSLNKIVTIFDDEQINYMLVGGFAMSFYNRFRFTADIDCVIHIHPHHVDQIIKYFPDWESFAPAFKENVAKGLLFNLTDFETGVKYDLMPYQDSDYSWTAFERRRKVDFYDTDCFIASPEDLIISKLKWYSISKSAKQLEDIKFLLKESDLDMQYLIGWSNRLTLLRHGLF